ncbi:MAG: hypothetical protein AAF411_12410 [Myxococcota bacterium]
MGRLFYLFLAISLLACGDSEADENANVRVRVAVLTDRLEARIGAWAQSLPPRNAAEVSGVCAPFMAQRNAEGELENFTELTRGEPLPPAAWLTDLLEEAREKGAFPARPTSHDRSRIVADMNDIHERMRFRSWDIVLIQESATAAQVERERDRYEPGRMRATAYVWSHQQGEAVCRKRIDVQNVDTLPELPPGEEVLALEARLLQRVRRQAFAELGLGPFENR